MKKFAVLLILVGLFLNGLYAQPAVVADTLRANSIHARLQSNGAFFLGGEFRVPAESGGAPEISLLQSAGLWIGGLDAAGQLHLAAQLYNDNGQSDWYPGTLLAPGVPISDFNLVAGTTQADVQAHQANPTAMLPSILGWPGPGNPFFSDVHGFGLPFGWSHPGAPFYDVFGDGLYNPFDGDYPAVGLRGCPDRFNVEQTLWTVFNNAGPHTQSGGAPLNIEVQTQFFAFECPEGSPADRAVYVVYKMLNFDTAVLDSVYFGVFLDVAIGNGDDDFIGCDPSRRVVFAYNGDDVDEGGFGATPPVLAVDVLRVPLYTTPDTAYEVVNWHFVPVDAQPLQAVTDPLAYYRLLTGHAADGTPLPNDGLLYTGDPLDPAAWSEVSAGNTPGDRRVLASFGPITLYPGAVNELVLGYAYVRRDPNGTLAENLALVGPTMDAVQAIFDNCFDLFDGCPGNVSASEPAAPWAVTVSPNPFADQLMVQGNGPLLRSVQLYDALGRLVREARGGLEVLLPTAALPAGLYVVRVQDAAGRTGAFRVVRQ